MSVVNTLLQLTFHLKNISKKVPRKGLTKKFLLVRRFSACLEPILDFRIREYTLQEKLWIF